MIEIIPVSERNPDNNVDTDKKFFIDNTIADSIAKKYNYAIENIVLKNKTVTLYIILNVGIG